jgi:SAM-dependent methyltransferase
MDWKFKARAYRILAAVPFGKDVHYLLQKHVTKELPRRVEGLNQLIVASEKIKKEYETHATHPLGSSHFIEIGAGRDLVIAIVLRMLGVGKVTCIDIDRLAKLDLVQYAANHVAGYFGRPAPVFKNWADVTNFGINYIAPASLEKAGLAKSSIDCFFSVDTLEHIPVNSLESIFSSAYQVLKPHGLFIHIIDYSDHYARVDSVSRFNFLTYSEKEWAPYNNSFQYVNRLRHSEYVAMLEKAGAKILKEAPDVVETQQVVLDQLDEQFRKFAIADLFAIRGMIVASAHK